jgi:hypothetical protein
MSSLNVLFEYQHVQEFVVLTAIRNFAAVLYKWVRAPRIKIDACKPGTVALNPCHLSDSLNALFEYQHVEEFVILNAIRNFAAVLYKWVRTHRIKIDARKPPPSVTTAGPHTAVTGP